MVGGWVGALWVLVLTCSAAMVLDSSWVHAGRRAPDADLQNAIPGLTTCCCLQSACPDPCPTHPCLHRRGLLHRTSSSMSRRSAADDAEMRLPIPGSPQPSGPSILGLPTGPAAPAVPDEPAAPVAPAEPAAPAAPAAAPAPAAAAPVTNSTQAQAQQSARGPRPWVPPGGPAVRNGSP